MTTAIITERVIERARAYFADNATVHVREAELELLLTHDRQLDLDSEQEYVVVGVDWCGRGPGGVVLLPDYLVVEDDQHPDGQRHDHAFDRVKHIDNAIAVLQRAKALLVGGAA